MKDRTPAPAPYLIVKKHRTHDGKLRLARQGSARSASEADRVVAECRKQDSETFGGLFAKQEPATYEVWRAEWSFVREDKPKG